MAVGGYNFCTLHGGGKRCRKEGCTKSAQSSTDFCVRHGGGKRCKIVGCEKVARGKTMLCMSHHRSTASTTSSTSTTVKTASIASTNTSVLMKQKPPVIYKENDMRSSSLFSPPMLVTSIGSSIQRSLDHEQIPQLYCQVISEESSSTI